MFSSIRAKFLAILLPLFLVSFIVLSGISYYVSNNALIDDADRIARRTGGMAGEYLDKVMTEKSIRLEELADHPAMRGNDRAAKIAALAAMKGRTQGFDMVAYVDLAGKAVSDQGVDMDRGSRDYFKQVVSTGKPTMTGPSVSGTTGKLITIMAYPVMTDTEKSPAWSSVRSALRSFPSWSAPLTIWKRAMFTSSTKAASASATSSFPRQSASSI